MLTELSIKDFAIIDSVSVTFNEGLTVLTGETGAGKSIIIDAVQLLAGGRGSVDYVRYGTKKAEIEGLFIIENKNHLIYTIGSYYGIEILDQMVVLQRTMTASGKSICRVNGKLVTLAILKEFGKTLIDIHSQHETQSLMEPESHIELLDSYDEPQIKQAKKEYSVLFDKYTSLQKRYKDFSENELETNNRLDLLEFQLNELSQSHLNPNEDEELEEERSHLVNFEKIYLGVETAYNALYGERKGIEWLNKAQLALQENREFDPFIANKADKLTDNFYVIEELSFELRDFKDTLHYDATRLNEIESRLHDLNNLKKKYGTSVNDMLAYMAEIEEEIEQLKNKDTHLIEIKRKIEETAQDAYLEAIHLHGIRRESAQLLEKEIHTELKDLYLANATISVSFHPLVNDDDVQYDPRLITLHKNGFDQIRFLISTNPGEPLKEIHKVASGGELSRIMLAIKKIFAKHQGVTSVIFDEVDTGVSGRVAQAMAEKIFEVSKESQVLCITHLPQVAAMADTHKLSKKTETNERTATNVTELTEQQQMEELGRMITGTKLTDTAKEHARELLVLAATFKNKKYNG